MGCDFGGVLRKRLQVVTLAHFGWSRGSSANLAVLSRQLHFCLTLDIRYRSDLLLREACIHDSFIPPARTSTSRCGAIGERLISWKQHHRTLYTLGTPLSDSVVVIA